MKRLALMIFVIALIVSACAPSTKTPPTAAELKAEYNRGMKEGCYFNPVGKTDDGQSVFLSEETCEKNIKSSQKEEFYENGSIPSTLEDAYYFGLLDDCRFNPIGTDENDEFIFRTDQDCIKWLEKAKNWKLYDQHILSGDTINIPDFLKTPTSQPTGRIFENSRNA